MSNLPGKAWMDKDGKHVWWEHRCADAKIVRSMLPFSQWSNQNGQVSPSIVCLKKDCGFHGSPLIGESPPDFVKEQP